MRQDKRRKAGEVAQSVRASDRHAADAGSNLRCGKGFFFLPVNFQCRLSYVCPHTPCAIVCINICAHVKDPVVHVRVRWNMETLKHPARTVGWVARLCRSWLSPKKTTWFSHWRNPVGTLQGCLFVIVVVLVLVVFCFLNSKKWKRKVKGERAGRRGRGRGQRGG